MNASALIHAPVKALDAVVQKFNGLSKDQKVWIGIGAGALTIALGLLWWRRSMDNSSDTGDSTDLPSTSPAATALFLDAQYKPNTDAANELFLAAAKWANLPQEWATDIDLHNLLASESAGWVGRPNYEFGDKSSVANKDQWPVVWAAIKDGSWRDLILPQYKSNPSSATGLGQLTVTNIDTGRFYPSKRDGIGLALEEAIGMLQYIAERYKTPAAAWSYHQQHGSY